jgi:hypothetical protein
MDNTDLRGAAFIIRNDKGWITEVVFSLAAAKKATRKKGRSFEIVQNALTEKATALWETHGS